MTFSDNDLHKVNQYFPKLKVINGAIQGEIEFLAMYVQDKRGQWLIEPCNDVDEKKCLKGNYQIKVITDEEGRRKVFETSGKITMLANQLKIPIQDLHINCDGSCCLGFYTFENLTVEKFILHQVYPFFVWQAYYEKFEKVPPCGEYSHSIMGALKEFLNDLKNIGRNDICFCGSGQKYKNCHYNKNVTPKAFTGSLELMRLEQLCSIRFPC